MNLYKYVFPTSLDNPERLAVIGMLRSVSSPFSRIEIQARLASRVFSQNVKLPPKVAMHTDVERKPKTGKKILMVITTLNDCQSHFHTILLTTCGRNRGSELVHVWYNGYALD